MVFHLDVRGRIGFTLKYIVKMTPMQGGRGIFYGRFMVMITLGSPTGRWLMAAAVLASSMAFIDATALNVVLPALQQSLGADATELFWVLNAYLLMLATLTLVGGMLGDRLGR
jgi:hypothetical protein